MNCQITVYLMKHIWTRLVDKCFTLSICISWSHNEKKASWESKVDIFQRLYNGIDFVERKAIKNEIWHEM